jgi:hypothetical protein
LQQAFNGNLAAIEAMQAMLASGRTKCLIGKVYRFFAV